MTKMQPFQTVISYFFLGITMHIALFFAIIYTLAMAATAVAVLLGCSVGDPNLGQEFLPVLFVPQLLFAGFFIPTDFIPIWLHWAQYLCSLTYAVRLTLKYDFQECADAAEAATDSPCLNLLENSYVDQLPAYVSWFILVALFLFFRISALLVLKRKAMTFF